MIHVVVPFESDDPHRLKALDFVRRHYARCFPWPVSIGFPQPTERYSRATAINNLVRELPAHFTLVVLNDADSLVPPQQIQKAVLLAKQQPGIVRAYTHYKRVSRRYTEDAKDPADILNAPQSVIEWEQDNAVSHGCLAMQRESFDAVGGYDPRFFNYMDDCAFDLVMSCFWPQFGRVSGPLYHMWHPRAPQVQSDDDLYYRRYERARGDREALLSIRNEVP